MVSERIHPITMPRWGMTMTEGKLVGWLAADGQAIEPGKDLLEIETTKITNVVGAPAAGVMRRQLVKEGVTVPVGTLLGVIAETDVSDSEIDNFVANSARGGSCRCRTDGRGSCAAGDRRGRLFDQCAVHRIRRRNAAHSDPWLRRRPQQLDVQSTGAVGRSTGSCRRSARSRRLGADDGERRRP